MYVIQDMVAALKKYRKDMASSEERCNNFTCKGQHSDSDRQESPFNKKISRLDERLSRALARLEERLPGIDDVIRSWEEFDRMKAGLSDWTERKAEEIRTFDSQLDAASPFEFHQMEVGLHRKLSDLINPLDVVSRYTGAAHSTDGAC